MRIKLKSIFIIFIVILFIEIICILFLNLYVTEKNNFNLFPILLIGMTSLGNLIFLSIIISKKISSLQSIISQIKKGELSIDKEFDFSIEDELAGITLDLSSFLSDLASYFIQIKNISISSNQLSDDLSGRSEDISGSVNEIAKNIDKIKNVSKDLLSETQTSASSISKIKDFTNNISQLINLQSTSITETSATIEEMIRSIVNISNISQKKSVQTENLSKLAKDSEINLSLTIKAIDNVSQSIKLIKDIVSVLDDISDTTSLLAMNAQIEAANAGHAGRGFTVVANEIQKLAKRSKENAENISTRTNDMLKSTAKMQNESDTLRNSIREIFTGINEVNSSMNELENGTSEMSLGSSQISEALVEIIEITKNVSDSSKEMENKISILEQFSEQIKTLSTLNVSSVDEIKTQIDYILNVSQMLSDLGKDNIDTNNSLKESSNLYKVHGNFVADTMPPFNYLQKGVPAGISVELGRYISEKAGQKFAAEFTHFNEAQKLVSENKNIMLSNILRTKEREEKYKWVGPIIRADFYLFKRKDNRELIANTYDDLKKIRIGCELGDIITDTLLKKGLSEGNQLIIYKDTRKALQDLIDGKIDAVPMADIQIAFELKEMQRDPDLICPLFYLEEISMDLWIIHGLKTSDELINKYQKILDEMKKNGEYRKIINKYLSK